jgi:serine phosphatase RsbU (regulator of sigma subunit)
MRYFYSFLVWFGLTTLALSAQAQTILRTASGEELSVEQCLEASKKHEQDGDWRGASDFLNKAALIRWEKKDYKSAIKYFKQSLQLNRRVDNKSGAYGIYSNLATIYADLEQYDSALVYFQRTLNGRRKSKMRVPTISALINTSVILNNLKRHSEAVELLTEALELAQETNDTDQMRSCYGMLAEASEKAGDAEKSRYYFEMYRGFHELTQQRKVKTANEAAEKERLRAATLALEKERAQLEIARKNMVIQQKEKTIASANDSLSELTENFTKQELSMKVMKQRNELREAKFAKEKAENEEKIAKQRMFLFTIGLGLLLVSLAAFFIYRSQQQKKKANEMLLQKNQEISQQQAEIMVQHDKLSQAYDQIEHKNQHITASINYAKRIQDAMLPAAEQIAAALPSSFVYFRPRDIVSGDFYFFHQHNDEIILAAIDCTGHGVPGAFMSMIGNEILNRIIRDQKITAPDLILNELHIGIRNALKQDETNNRDGMDIALVNLNPSKRTLTFAGAKNPIFYLQNNELQVIKGDKHPIGGLQKEEERLFTAHSVDISVPTTFYLCSDGYQDAFGGKDGNKFMVGNFKKLLTNIHVEPIAKQREILDDVMNQWLDNRHRQIDDILVIGVQV